MLLASLVLLPFAHSHNDYAQKRPLLEALDNGFMSLEADIFLIDGELRVAHDRKDAVAGRTLESMYLDPLAKRVKENKGTVYGQPGTLVLLVDIKTDGPAVQAELAKRLPKYRAMLSERTGERVNARAIQIILSGARTADCAATDGFLFKDGVPADVNDPAFRTPQISESYMAATGTLTTPLPNQASEKLRSLVNEAHQKGKRVRLWGTPYGPATWADLKNQGLDWINTDRLADLRRYFTTKTELTSR